MLLLEIGWENQPQTLPATYAFAAANPFDGEGWFEEVTAYPHRSSASAELVSEFNRIIANGNWHPTNPQYPFIEMGILTDHPSDGGVVLQGPERPALCTSCYWSRLVANLDDDHGTGAEWKAFAESVGWNVNLVVPLLGQGLSGYHITGVDRIVTADAQTIRIYGVVPEPASFVLALLGLCHVNRLRLRSK